MFSLQVNVDTRGLDRLTQRVQEAPARFAELIDSEVVPASQQRDDEELNVAPPHIQPTQWQTDHQRRWWFAVGRLTWHGRKAKQDWTTQHRPSSERGAIVVVHPFDWAKYVWTPPYQQRMHIGTWLSSNTFAALEVQLLSRDLSAAWRGANA